MHTELWHRDHYNLVVDFLSLAHHPEILSRHSPTAGVEFYQLSSKLPDIVNSIPINETQSDIVEDDI